MSSGMRGWSPGRRDARIISPLTSTHGRNMNLSELHRDALLTLANTVAGHDYVPQDVLDELVSMGLVDWRSPDEVILTGAGENIYQRLAAGICGDAVAGRLV